jgi:8-oxo-dGTP pyrophosphatase MutT (NUDIX family)
MSRVLVVPRSALGRLPLRGTWGVTAPNPEHLPCAWLARDQAETDEAFLQIIPYALIRDAAGQLWCYERLGGDARVRHRWSCGVGGHVDETDRADGLLPTAIAALQRELAEELAWSPARDRLHPAAWLYEGESAIGRVHLGLIVDLVWDRPDPPTPAPGEPLGPLGFRPAAAIAADERFELWSRLAAGWASATP